MSGEIYFLLTSTASLVTSVASLLFTVGAYRRLDAESSEAFAVVGADEGNHEARLERLEMHAGLQVISSPSALADAFEDEAYVNEFANGEEDAALRADEDAATNEGMAHHGD